MLSSGAAAAGGQQRQQRLAAAGRPAKQLTATVDRISGSQRAGAAAAGGSCWPAPAGAEKRETKAFQTGSYTQTLLQEFHETRDRAWGGAPCMRPGRATPEIDETQVNF